MTRNRKRRLLLMAGVVAVSAILLTGCKATGGGYIPHGSFDNYSETNPPIGKKATFGFVWQSTENNPYLASGSWTDGAVRFRLAGGMIMTDSNGQDGDASGMGSYVSTNKTYQSPDDPDGTLCIYLDDNGEGGLSNGDYLRIEIKSGPYAGYHAEGYLNGGNLQIKQ